MPERILRDLTDSEAYNAAPVQARDLFIRIINKADDFGLYFADARRTRPFLYPLLLDQVREADLERWTAECGKAGLIRFYDAADGRKYLYVNKWRQRLRNKRSKFPEPPWGYRAPPDDGHMSDTRQSNDGHPRTETETYSETEAEVSDPGLEVSEADRAAARRAFNAWSQRDRRKELDVLLNEHRSVHALLNKLAQEPPIIRNGKPVPRQQLVAIAVAELMKRGAIFKPKGAAYACGCVESHLADMAAGILDRKNGKDGGQRNHQLPPTLQRTQVRPI